MDVPYGSILAAILVCIGVGIFCGTCQVAMIETSDMFELTGLDERAQDFFSPMMISVYAVTGLMVFMSILFVFISFMATTQSKRQIYEDDTVPCGGRCCTTFVLIIGYMLTFLWIVINGAIILPIIFTIMISRYYDYLDSNGTITSTDCIDLAYYGFTDTGGRVTDVCGADNLKIFASSADTAFLFYVVAYGGSVIVLLGMAHFLMCMSANWGHLKDGLKRRDYEKKRQQEEDELEHINAGYAHENHHPPRAHHRNTGPAVMVPESYEMRGTAGRGGPGPEAYDMRGTGGRGGGGPHGGGGPPQGQAQMNGYY